MPEWLAGAVSATASWVISGSIYRFRFTTMTTVNDLQIGSAFPVSNRMRRHNQTPSPWNEAGPSAPCKRSKLAAGALAPVQEAPCCGDASWGETGGFAMQPPVCARRQQDAARHQLGVRLVSALATTSSSLAIASSKSSDWPRSSSAIPSCTSRISAPCRRHIVERRRQTRERGRSIAAAIRSSFSSTSDGTRTETGVEPTLFGSGLSEWRCVSPYDLDHWRSQFDARTLLNNSSTGEPPSANHPRGGLL